MKKATFLELGDKHPSAFQHQATQMRRDLSVQKQVCIVIRLVASQFGISTATVGAVVLEIYMAIITVVHLQMVKIVNVLEIVVAYKYLGFLNYAGLFVTYMCPLSAPIHPPGTHGYVNPKGYK